MKSMHETGLCRNDDALPKVVVTGIGLVTSLGAGREATWEALRNGRTGACRVGVGDLREPPHAGYPAVGTTAPAGNHDPVLGLLDRAASEAQLDAGWRDLPCEPERVGCLIGLSKGGVHSLACLARKSRGGDSPLELGELWVHGTWPHAGAARVAGRVGTRGPCLGPVAACATGLVAVIQGTDLIRRGVCDVVLAGAADASLEPFLLAAFRRMRALARCGPGDDPAQVVRPLDRRRTGFLVGEGAAVVVLERESEARGRGARVYAEVAGGALGSDAFHLTDLDPDPTNLAGLIRRALATSGVELDEIDHINLHGTATRANDPVECGAVRMVFGERAGDIACSANKAQIGHLLGAAGAAELALTCLAIRDGFVPPTLNLTDPDPACQLDATPGVGRSRTIRAALKLSLGFGGHLAVAVLRAPE